MDDLLNPQNVEAKFLIADLEADELQQFLRARVLLVWLADFRFEVG
jgi:hypothetical protein